MNLNRFVWGAFALAFIGWGLWSGMHTTLIMTFNGYLSCGSSWSPITDFPAPSGSDGDYAVECGTINAEGSLLAVVAFLVGAVFVFLTVQAIRPLSGLKGSPMSRECTGAGSQPQG